MGRIKRNREVMTTIAIPIRLKESIEREKQHDETMSQRLSKIYTMYKNNDTVFWFNQYEKVKSEVIELRKRYILFE